MKKYSILALVLMLSILFTGCAPSEVKLYDAFIKAQDITSMENDTKLNLTLEFKNFPNETQQQLEEANKMLKNLEFNVHMKQKSNKDKTVAMAEMITDMNLGGMIMGMDTWVDMDLSKDEPKMEAIIKMPQLFMNQIAAEDTSKEYIVYDYIKIMDLAQEEFDFNEFMKTSMDFNEKILEFTKEYYKDFEPGFKIVDYKGKKAIDGETLSIYEVKLNDDNFKELIRYMVNDSIDNEDSIKLFKEYMDMILQISQVTEVEKEEALTEINESMEELKENLPELKDKFNKFIDTFKDVKVLGEEGIVIEYGVNKNGYVVREVGKMDINIDLKALGQAFEEDVLSENAGILKLSITFDSKAYNINEKIEINIPEVNEKNSVSFNEILEQNTNTIEESEEVPVK